MLGPPDIRTSLKGLGETLCVSLKFCGNSSGTYEVVALRSPRSTQGLLGFRHGTLEESENSPERVPWAGPQKSRKSALWSLKRVRNESESQVLDSFRTLLRLRGALFWDSGGPASGNLSGLFWPEEAGDAVWGGADCKRGKSIRFIFPARGGKCPWVGC